MLVFQAMYCGKPSSPWGVVSEVRCVTRQGNSCSAFYLHLLEGRGVSHIFHTTIHFKSRSSLSKTRYLRIKLHNVCIVFLQASAALHIRLVPMLGGWASPDTWRDFDGSFGSLWQNHPNQSGSSALTIIIKAIQVNTHFKRSNPAAPLGKVPMKPPMRWWNL